MVCQVCQRRSIQLLPRHLQQCPVPPYHHLSTACDSCSVTKHLPSKEQGCLSPVGLQGFETFQARQSRQFSPKLSTVRLCKHCFLIYSNRPLFTKPLQSAAAKHEVPSALAFFL